MLIRRFRGADGAADTYSAPPTSAAVPCGLELPAQSRGQLADGGTLSITVALGFRRRSPSIGLRNNSHVAFVTFPVAAPRAPSLASTLPSSRLLAITTSVVPGNRYSINDA